MSDKIAVISGASRGIGFGVAKALAQKSYQLVLLARDAAALDKAAQSLTEAGVKVSCFAVDISDAKRVKYFAQELARQIPCVDVLINCAGVIIETQDDGSPSDLAHVDSDKVLETLNINSVGALRMTQALLPLLRAADAARIVNISSGMGALNDMEGGWPGYRMSKAALNALTKITAAETHNTNIKVNSVCPGWVRTDMGGSNADRSVDEAVPGILWAAELDAQGPNGGFFRDGRAIDW